MIVSHKIELSPSEGDIKYLERACAVDRFTYNWALDRYKEQLRIYQESRLDK